MRTSLASVPTLTLRSIRRSRKLRPIRLADALALEWADAIGPGAVIEVAAVCSAALADRIWPPAVFAGS
jgi:hypothetical protein